jgi:hypothetical protein
MCDLGRRDVIFSGTRSPETPEQFPSKRHALQILSQCDGDARDTSRVPLIKME